MGLRYGRRRGWRFALATAAAVAATGSCHQSRRALMPQPAKPTQPDGVCQPGQRHAAEARRLRHQGRPLGPHGQVPADRGRQSGRRRPPVPQLGEPGYKASADYVADVMRAAGYDVTLQEYKFHYFSFVGDPVLREESPTPHSFGLGTDFNPGPVAGSTSAKLQPAGGIIVPATPTPSSASGCSGLRLRWVRRGQHRPDPAGHVHVRPEGGERRGRRRLGGRHLQRGQPRTYQPIQREPRQVLSTSPSSSRPTPWAPSSWASTSRARPRF